LSSLANGVWTELREEGDFLASGSPEVDGLRGAGLFSTAAEYDDPGELAIAESQMGLWSVNGMKYAHSYERFVKFKVVLA
jgi:hypothetical protein